MGGTVVNETSTRKLRELCSALAASLPETIGSLIGRPLDVQPVGIEIHDRDGLLGSLARNHAIVRGALEKRFAGRHLGTLFGMQDASTMVGLLMMTPAEVLEQRRGRDDLAPEELEAFGELGNVLCTGFANVLRERVPDLDFRLQDHGTVGPGRDPKNLLPEGALMVFSFRMQIADHPETLGRIVCDRATAEAWNKGSLTGGASEPAAAAASPRPMDAVPARNDEVADDVPAAPIRGVLNAYLAAADAFATLRRSCRRVGLELRRHGRGEIPNPAAHRNEIVVIDVPVGEEKRLDWCRRIKDYSSTTKVVVLLQMASRGRVTVALKSQADAILGLPVDESLLSNKLSALLGP